MSTKLPLRMRVLTYINTVAETTIEKAMEALQGEYGQERQFSYPNFLGHFLALKENGLIDDIDYQLGEKNQLIISYAINAEGKEVLRKYG